MGTTAKQQAQAQRVREHFAQADRLLDNLLAAREQEDERAAHMIKDELRRLSHTDPRKHWEIAP